LEFEAGKEDMVQHPAEGHDQPHEQVEPGEKEDVGPAAKPEGGFEEGKVFRFGKEAQV
jgi:hypothetical protein